MPSRKSAAVSSSQWTESFAGGGGTDCARARCEAFRIVSRMEEMVRRGRAVIGEFSPAANFSTRNASTETNQELKKHRDTPDCPAPIRKTPSLLFQEHFPEQLRADDLPNFRAL